MGLIKRTVTIPSGTLNRNLIAGEIFEFLQRPAAVRLGATQEVVAGSMLELDWNLGNVIGGQGLTPNLVVTPGVVDRSVDFFPALTGRPPDRIQLMVREVTGGVGADGILNFILEIMDLA